MARAALVGVVALGLALPIYASDSWNNSLATDPFLKGLTLAALLLPWVVFVGVQGGAGRPRFAVSLLLLMLGGSFLFGVWTLARRRSVLLALPAALLVNLTLTLAVDPKVLRSNEPAELFRHLAYGLPIGVAVAAVGAWEALRRLPRRIAWPGPLAALVVVALIGGISMWRRWSCFRIRSHCLATDVSRKRRVRG